MNQFWNIADRIMDIWAYQQHLVPYIWAMLLLKFTLKFTEKITKTVEVLDRWWNIRRLKMKSNEKSSWMSHHVIENGQKVMQEVLCCFKNYFFWVFEKCKIKKTELIETDEIFVLFWFLSRNAKWKVEHNAPIPKSK